MTTARPASIWSWRPPLSLLPVILSAAALLVALFPPGPPSGRTVWMAARPLPAGTLLEARDLLPLELAAGAAVPGGTFPAPPVGWRLIAAAAPGTVISPRAVTRHMPKPQPPPSSLLVTIPLPIIPPGLGAHGAVMLLLAGPPSPQVLVARAPVAAVLTTAQGSFVSVSLPLGAAELVEYALAGGKVVVLPWHS